MLSLIRWIKLVSRDSNRYTGKIRRIFTPSGRKEAGVAEPARLGGVLSQVQILSSRLLIIKRLDQKSDLFFIVTITFWLHFSGNLMQTDTNRNTKFIWYLFAWYPGFMQFRGNQWQFKSSIFFSLCHCFFIPPGCFFIILFDTLPIMV